MSATLNRFLRMLAISLVVWAGLGALIATQMVVAGGFTWSEAAALAGRDWMPWAGLSPLLFLIVERHPLEAGAWMRRLPIYLAGGIAVAALVELAVRGSGPDPTERFRQQRRAWMQERMAERARRTGEEPPEPFAPPWRPGPEGPPGRPGGPPPGRGLLLTSGRVRWNLAVYGVVVSLAHAALFQRRSAERERRSLELAAGLAEARIRALRMQLQPHFLFNTLNAVATLVHQDPDGADEMLGNLSEFLRLTLEQGDQPLQPLRRELEFVDRYLAIEQVRFQDRLRHEHAIDPTTLDIPVPTLLLQPLVENAIRHGLEPRRETGMVRIDARRLGDRLELTVADDGIGVPADGPAREGIGLRNTRERLREIYGAEARLEIGPAIPRGTRVRIELPTTASAGTPGRTA